MASRKDELEGEIYELAEKFNKLKDELEVKIYELAKKFNN